MDYLYIEKVIKEVKESIEKKRISEAFLKEGKFSLKFGDKLYLNTFFKNPNAFFISDKPISEARYPYLSQLKGAYVKEVLLPYPDRVVELILVKPVSAAEIEKLSLVLELTGKNANLLLLDSKRKIKFILRAAKTSVRELSINSPYSPPPTEKREFNSLKFGKVSPQGIERELYKHVLKISPLNAKEIACLFKETGDLSKAFLHFMEKHKSSKKAYLYYKNGKPKFLTTFPYCSLKELPFKEFSGRLPFSSAWEDFFKEKVVKGEIERLKTKIVKSLQEKLKALLKEKEELERKEEIEKKAEKLKKIGELLKVNLSLVKPGKEEVELLDYETGEKIKVPLKPELSPQKNLENIFKEYKKLKRKAQISEERLKELKEEILTTQLLIEFVRECEEEEKLKELLPQKRKRGKEINRKLTVFTLPSGRKLLIGKSAKENEIISLKLSNPWEMWFHAKETPGSHVVLKLGKGEKPTDEEILIAASAAAYFSKARNSGKVPVDYTLVKNLKKPPGTQKGFITYREEKTLWVKPEIFEEKVLKSPRRGEEVSEKKR
ncbi:NFACT RNA binding domain-containing protein [Thermovibrio sp.]